MVYFIKCRQNINHLEWDNIVHKSLDSSYFALTAWLNGILAITQFSLVDQSFGVFCGNKLVAVVPLQWNSKSKSLLSSGWGWCGPIFLVDSSKLHHFVHNYIENIAFALSANKIVIGMYGAIANSSSARRGVNPWVQFDYKDVSSYTQIISLLNKSYDDLWYDTSQTSRQLIKKAQKTLMIKQVSWQEHLIRYYELHKWTCKQSNIAPHSFQYFELISRLSPENHKLFAAFNQDNVPVAYHNDLCFKENVFYHTAASSEEGNSKHAHYLLTWSSILSAHSEFYKNYEIGEICFGNVSKKHKQISFFKTRFGGELHRFFRADKEYEYLSRINILKKILKSTLDLACTFVANK